MKKQNKLLFLILVLSLITLIAINLIHSQETNPSTPAGTPNPTIAAGTDPETGLPRDVLPIKKAGDVLTNEDKRTAYLKAEWEKILLKSETFGPAVRFLLKLDPVSKILLGIPINFSWFFFLTLVIFIAFAVIIYRITALFEIQNKWLHIIIALGIIAITAYYRQPKSIAAFAVGLISILNKSWWMQYVIIGIVILAVIMAAYFSKQLEIVWKWIKERNEKNIEQLSKQKFEENMKAVDELKKIAIK